MVITTAPAAPPSDVGSLLAGLDDRQRAAALLPSGPAQVIAPAGSGKTTTLVARLGVLLQRGVDPDAVCVLTFNRDAAAELRRRIDGRLGPHARDAPQIEVRTLHALSRRILLDAGVRVDLMADRAPLLRAARRRCAAGRAPDAPPLPEVATLDAELSAWKVEGREPSPSARPLLESFEALLAARGAIDFDDLVRRATQLLEADAALRHRWQRRFTHLCVDEFQDVDAAQLRLIGLLAEPQRNLLVVGDDDQTIYAWRLADVRRILTFGERYPEARRVILATNYRCPPAVVLASRRLIEVNRERFAKPIRPAPGLSWSDDAVGAVRTDLQGWSDRLAQLAAGEAAAGRSCCFLGRTRADVEPMLLALSRAELPHATSFPLILDLPAVRRLLDEVRRRMPAGPPLPALLSLRSALGWRRDDPNGDLDDEEHAALDAALGWATAFPTVEAYLAAAQAAQRRLQRLRDPTAPVEVATVHGAKGREWSTVVVVGFEEERFPNRRALVGTADATRALEEERRLAYVAVTRATRRLILAFDPARPSRFLGEMGYRPTSGATTDR